VARQGKDNCAGIKMSANAKPEMVDDGKIGDRLDGIHCLLGDT